MYQKGLNSATLTGPVLTKWFTMKLQSEKAKYNYLQTHARLRYNEGGTEPASQEVHNFLNVVVWMNILERLSLVWRTLFPSPTVRRRSVANIAKQCLKMILFSDQCGVSDEAEQRIVTSVLILYR